MFLISFKEQCSHSRTQLKFRSLEISSETTYPKVYKKWEEAANMLWGSDSDQRHTTIGHLCREAMQEFTTALVEKYNPVDVDEDKAHTVSRMRSVLKSKNINLSTTEKPFLEGLIGYWGTTIDLVQRQEHGDTKEGEPLKWEDSRRVVFQTAIVMFEIDKALS